MRSRAGRFAAAMSSGLAVTLAVVVATPAAAAGELDSSYGTGGVTTLPVANILPGHSVAAQPDGKDIVVGVGTQSHLVVARLTPDGALDPSYAGDGTATVIVGARTPPMGVIVDSAGRAVVLALCSPSPHLCLIRLLPDGALDASFGDGGISQQPPFVTKSSVVWPDGLAEQVVGGHRYLVVTGTLSGATGFGVERFNEDGSLDRTFGVAGTAATALPVYSGASAIAVDSKGRLVLSGYASPSGQPSFVVALVRFLPSGQLDPTFGVGGHVIDAGSPSPSSGQVGKDVVVDSSDRVVVVADAPDATPDADDFAVERYLSDGLPDPGFGSNGRALVDMGGMEYANALTVRPDGRLLLVGQTSQPGTLSGSQYALAQLLPTGTLDPTFGQGGIVANGFDGFVSSYGSAVVVQGGAAIVAGYPRIVARYRL